ncbi:hypothetical protein GCM10023165_54140 [Variovorax defluvii]|uniref:Transglutaminase-like domain-containing protein n=1 Tax=Variovorax defluvii TaxID=913761 RepID=A0ABP8IHG1_9BURK
MPKLARACAVVVAVATSLAGGIAAAQIQSGNARKTAAPSIALGVPAAAANANSNATTKTHLSQRSSSSTATRSGSPVTFTSGQPALQYQAADLPSTKDPVRREAVKEGAKDVGITTRGTGATTSTSTEFAPAPGVLRANMPPVTFAEAERVLSSRTLPANVNQGTTAARRSDIGKLSTRSAKISGDASPLGPASIAELARSLRNHPDLIYQYVRNNVEYYPTFGIQKGALGAVLDNQATAHDQATLMVELLRASSIEADYVRGIVKLSAAQLAEWWGVNTANVCGVLSLLGHRHPQRLRLHLRQPQLHPEDQGRGQQHFPHCQWLGSRGPRPRRELPPRPERPQGRRRRRHLRAPARFDPGRHRRAVDRPEHPFGHETLHYP